MKIFHDETSVWRRINDLNDVLLLIHEFEFENSQITEMHFRRSGNIQERDTDKFTFILDVLFITFDNRIDITKPEPDELKYCLAMLTY